MKKMVRFEVIRYGFQKGPDDDKRLGFDGEDFNDYQFGYGDNEAEAMQFAIELITDSGVEPSKSLLNAISKASKEKNEESGYNLAIRYYYDRRKEDAEADARLMALIEAKRAKRLEMEANGELDEDILIPAGA